MHLEAGHLVEFQSFGAITQEQLVRYAQASRDPNPIHLDPAIAQAAGLPGVIAHGMLIAGMIAERARLWVEANPTLMGFEVTRFQSRFKAMTHLGDTPSIGGVVKTASDQEICLELQAKNQRGEVTTTSQIRLKRSS